MILISLYHSIGATLSHAVQNCTMQGMNTWPVDFHVCLLYIITQFALTSRYDFPDYLVSIEISDVNA